MSRPIVWATATAMILVLSSTWTGLRLAAHVEASRGEGGEAQSHIAGESGEAVVTVSADLAGHFVVHPSLDGRRVRMLIDTGASIVALSYEDAQMAGIAFSRANFTRKLATANGTVDAAPVRIREIQVGDIVVRNVDAVVLPQGRLATSLLGMSFLKRLDGFEIARGQLTLKGSTDG
jgi:aspartyl protease family protein